MGLSQKLERIRVGICTKSRTEKPHLVYFTFETAPFFLVPLFHLQSFVSYLYHLIKKLLPTTSTIMFHIEELSPLYEDVQMSRIFPDSKFFVDCTPKFGINQILENYAHEKTRIGFDLKNFVGSHFDHPADPVAGYHSAHKDLDEHLDSLWDVLTRDPKDQQDNGTLIPLPHPYIVPGGRFREIYYWDSFFTMQGLIRSGRADMATNMVDNFAYLIGNFGHVPNGNRTYYLSRSQPPFFCCMVELLDLIDDSGKTLLKYQSALEKEYAYWMDGADTLSTENTCNRRAVRLPDGAVLNRYWDDKCTPRPESYIEDVEIAHRSGRDAAVVYRHIRAAAESGWDFSSRWFGDGKTIETIETTDILPIDLNCLLYDLELLLQRLYKNLKKYKLSKKMSERANQRYQAIEKYCWSEALGCYGDYHHVDGAFIDRPSLAMLYPLYFKLASNEQAKKVGDYVEQHFLKAGGLVTTNVASGQQWDSPNGWAPLQWLGFIGFLMYENESLATKIQNRWQAINESVYQNTGKMMEKYNVIDTNLEAGGGEYPGQDGFGWTNGVYLGMG
jgi:alpha,alpha-trehalase